MSRDFQFLPYFIVPIAVIFVIVLLRICWKCACCIKDSANDQPRDSPVYVIQIGDSTHDAGLHYDGHDYDDRSNPFDPPSYSSLNLPPMYSEFKCSDEAPPSYCDLAILSSADMGTDFSSSDMGTDFMSSDMGTDFTSSDMGTDFSSSDMD